MLLYKCFVPSKDWIRTKDIRDVVLTKLYKKIWKNEPDLSLGQVERRLAAMVREEYLKQEGTISVHHILTQINKQLTKEGY